MIGSNEKDYLIENLALAILQGSETYPDIICGECLKWCKLILQQKDGDPPLKLPRNRHFMSRKEAAELYGRKKLRCVT